MKKIYIVPTLKVVKIETRSIMAGSIIDTNNAEGLGVGDSWTSGSAGSRRGNLWDDDDE